MTETDSISAEARPTVRQARSMIGLGRLTMGLYTEWADKSSKLHPEDVMHIAQLAHADGRLRYSFNEVADSLLGYAATHDAEAVPAVEQVIYSFFEGRDSSTLA